jgi:hypothetical protein
MLRFFLAVSGSYDSAVVSDLLGSPFGYVYR